MYRRRTKHLPDPSRTCQCGQPLRGVGFENSGTTRFSQACPILVAHWREHGNDPWASRNWPAGHQFVITSKPDHDPGCCSIRELHTVPGDLSGRWPFDDPAHAPADVDLYDQALRAMLDVIGARAAADEAWRRVLRARDAAGITDHAQAIATISEAFRDAGARAEGRPEQHGCDHEHRTYRQVALCAYGNDYSTAKVTGRGPWALVSFCARPTVLLFASQRDAVKHLRRWEDGSCDGGKRCRDRHSLRLLPELAKPSKGEVA